jgi:hypothetical protein
MITSDHPNKKVAVLPKMLVSAVTSKIIGFSEKGNSQSTKNLMSMGLEYNLYPPVSGPAIERMILKIKKDEETKKKAKAARTSAFSENSSEDDMIKFKNEGSSDDNKIINLSGARAALSSLIDSSEEDGTDSSGPGGYIPGNSESQGQGGFASGDPGAADPQSSAGGIGGRGAAYMPHHQNSGGFDSSGPAYDPQAQGSGSSVDPSDGRAGMPGYMPSSGGPSDPTDPHYDPTVEKNQEYFNQTGKERRPLDPNKAGSPISAGSQPQGQLDDEDPANPNPNPNPTREPHFRNRREGVQYDGSPKKEELPYTFTTEAEKKNPEKKQSILVKGTESALNETVNNFSEGPAKEKIDRSSDIACITVESPRFSGYLICAFGRKRAVDQELISVLQNRLFAFLKANGEDIKDKKMMNLKIQEVDFTSWSLAQAEFLKKSVHNGEEIAIAFFPKDVSDIELGDSASQKMVQININDLKEEARVEFDLYIFMPANNKYLLYTPKGKPFYENQKGRLVDGGVKHLHLKKDEAHEVRRYQAQNFLNDKIEAFAKQKA